MSSLPLSASGAQETTTTGGEAAPFRLRPVFAGRTETSNMLGVAVWFMGLLWFWAWWLNPVHVASVPRYLVMTSALLWLTWVQGYFIVVFNNALSPTGTALPMPGARVAVVVAKAPSEPFSVARKTLEAALAQEGVVHDTWLADEDPDAETLAWCKAHGVRVSTRKGVAEYQRAEWPRRAACKEGNLAYFYDRYGYDGYDFVAQFDVDHAPTPTYLKHALAPFADSKVGYVSAPSICDSNAAGSWSARGRLYVEAYMHGPLQTGYNDGWAPLCIGSHYVIRTAALRAAGGLGPELAEDHSTTLILNAAGWRGVHAADAIAHGQGPETFGDLITQEFQWSRSLVTILIRHMPRYFAKLPARLKFQFVFSESWYPIYSSVAALAFLMPMFALVTKARFANVTYADYVVHALPLSSMLLLMAYWWRSMGLFRPVDAKVVSWEAVAFLFARWPWSLFGSLTAILDCISGKTVPFRITPKGVRHTDPVPFRVIAPYVAVAAASAGCAWLVSDPGTAAGFYIINLVNAAWNWGLIVLVLVMHGRENHCPIVARNITGLASALSVVGVATLMGLAAYENGPRGLAAVNVGVQVITLTEAHASPAGAGRGRKVTYRLHPRWNGFGAPPQEPAPSAGVAGSRRR